MVKFRTLGLVSAAIAPAYGFWRMECRGVTGYYRIDPLVSPGEPSSHVHSIQGSGGFSETATFDDLRASNCTSCLVTQDKSAYWHPPLYFQDSSGEFQLVDQVGGTLAYYLLNTGNGNTNITAFPEGFRMIAGDNTRRSFTAGNVEMVDPPKSDWAALNQTTQDHLAQRAIGFNCLDYSATAEASLYRHFLPDKTYLDANCPDGIRFELMFPSCWNGVDLDSDNHKDHVAYPDLVMSGDCPDDFPVRLPSLFYETIWDTAAFSDQTGEFAISNGDVQGFAYHGDFMTGWDVDFLQEAVDTCTSDTGEIEDCSIFTIQTQAEAQTCKLETPENLADEDTEGPGLTSLPGDLSLFGYYMDATMIATYDTALSSVPATTSGLEGGPGISGATTTAAAADAGTTAATTEATTTAVANTVTTSTSSTASAANDITALNNNAASTPATTFTTSTSSTSSTTPTSSTSSTTVPAATTAATTTVAAAGTQADGVSIQYVTSNGVVTEIVWEQATIYETETSGLTTSWETVTVTASAPAVKGRRAHNHMRRHHRHGQAI